MLGGSVNRGGGSWSPDIVNPTINEKTTAMQDMLRGEVTQAVSEVRYSMYRILEESERFGKHGALTKTPEELGVDTIGNKMGFKIICVQENKKYVAGVLETLNEVDGNLVDKNDTIFKLTRNFIPKFKIEEFASKFVIKQNSNNEKDVVVEIYTSTYPQQFMKRHAPFIKELESIYNQTNLRSEILEINTIDFTTLDSYIMVSGTIINITDLTYVNIRQFNGEYVLGFRGVMNNSPQRLSEKYYDETQAKKYVIKEEKEFDTTKSWDDAVNSLYEKPYDYQHANNVLEKLRKKQ